MADDDVDVRDNPKLHRYEITVGGELAGFARYTPRDSGADFTHTEIDDRFEGRGLGGRLIGTALDDARRRGWQIVPTCPFVRAFIAKHPEYLELVPADQRARFDLPA